MLLIIGIIDIMSITGIKLEGNNMAKTICFNYDGKDYTLEYTRASVRAMENRGFKPNDLIEKPMNTLPELFAGAFLANHRFTKREVIDDIYAAMGNKEELVNKLAEMYNDPISALMAEPDNDGGEKNVKWDANW